MNNLTDREQRLAEEAYNDQQVEESYTELGRLQVVVDAKVSKDKAFVALLEALKEASDCLGELIHIPLNLGTGFNSSIDDWLVNETGNDGWWGLADRISGTIAQALGKNPI